MLGHEELEDEVMNKHSITREKLPPKPTRAHILESWVESKIDFHAAYCKSNGHKEWEGEPRYDLVQHQGLCVECMRDNSYTNQLISLLHSGECQMCGRKLTSEDTINVCNSCCSSAAGETEEEREENFESVLEHCKEIVERKKDE